MLLLSPRISVAMRLRRPRVGSGRLSIWPSVMVALVRSGIEAGVQPMQLSGACRFCLRSRMPSMSRRIWKSSARRPAVQSAPVLLGLRLSGKVPSLVERLKWPFPATWRRPCAAARVELRWRVAA